ncbi:MAG: LysR family transcriptional regulator [Pseudomonadota bacterium]
MDTLTRMQAFVDVVDAEGFSAAARKVGRSKALMSKYVRELEDELGILLLNRTTRQFSLTEAGNVFHRSALEILQKVGDLQDKVREAGTGHKGRLRISAPRSLTDLEIGLPIVEFAAAYPDITLDINLDDAMVDMVEDGFDVAIRVSRLTDSSLIAKKLAEFRLILCATPAFIEEHGTPTSPEDLGEAPCIVDTNMMRRANWCFLDANGEEFNVPVRGAIEVNSPEVARRAALAGLGMTMAPEFSVEREIASGELVSLLEDQIPAGGGIYAVYPHRRHVPGKVRVFVDFLTRWFKEKSRYQKSEEAA